LIDHFSEVSHFSDDKQKDFVALVKVVFISFIKEQDILERKMAKRLMNAEKLVNHASVKDCWVIVYGKV
jgi:cytochrome b involved in lipid metabolism